MFACVACCSNWSYKYLKSGMDLVDKIFLKGKGMIKADAIEISHAKLELVTLSWSYSVMVVTSWWSRKLPLINMLLVSSMDNRQYLFQRNNVRGHLGSWWELPILKSVYLLEKQNKVRDSLSIVCKCMRSCLLTCCCLPYICLQINARGIYCGRRWRLWIACWMPLYLCLKSCNGFTTVILAV